MNSNAHHAREVSAILRELQNGAGTAVEIAQRLIDGGHLDGFAYGQSDRIRYKLRKLVGAGKAKIVAQRRGRKGWHPQDVYGACETGTTSRST